MIPSLVVPKYMQAFISLTKASSPMHESLHDGEEGNIGRHLGLTGRRAKEKDGIRSSTVKIWDLGKIAED
ncbi:hypothetical protein PAXINDRAFT_13129 [Paxillus involutus ATCC 200175]|uniref:Uncharacterized protein n=1 Tax=Paxillus involutus ATCC 200175 TaxID=664439 RepID=A0A0C9U3A6_PAXIN|nr:hypothetical protein PAXINDRAFT_13129 [Paxillus involutus ATCC 200175]